MYILNYVSQVISGQVLKISPPPGFDPGTVQLVAQVTCSGYYYHLK
jgi:hypothetical protein